MSITSIVRGPLVAGFATLALVAVGGGVASAMPITSSNGNSDVCKALDSGKIDVVGEKDSVTVTAPDGYLIADYCVKAGSTQGGTGGPVYVDVNPDAASVTIVYPSGKNISHYSFSTVKATPPKPADKVVNGEWGDGEGNCETRKVEQTRTVTTTPYVLVDGDWVLDTENATEVTESQTRDMTDEEFAAVCTDGEQPADKVDYGVWQDGMGDCETGTVEQARTVTTTPYVLVDGEWVPDTENATVTNEYGSRDMTEEELAECEVVVVPEIAPVDVVSFCGYVEFTNPADNTEPIIVLYGLFENGEPDGNVEVAPGETIKVPTDRNQIDYVAYGSETDTDAGMGSVTVEQKCGENPPPKPPPSTDPKPNHPPFVAPKPKPTTSVKQGPKVEADDASNGISGTALLGLGAGATLLGLGLRRRIVADNRNRG